MLQHLRRHINETGTTVLIVICQAEDTLGRKLLEGAKLVKIYGEEEGCQGQDRGDKRL